MRTDVESAIRLACKQYYLKPVREGWDLHFYNYVAGAPCIINFDTYDEALARVTDNRVLNVLRILGATDKQMEHVRKHKRNRLRDRIYDALAADPGGETGEPIMFTIA